MSKRTKGRNAISTSRLKVVVASWAPTKISDEKGPCPTRDLVARDLGADFAMVSTLMATVLGKLRLSGISAMGAGSVAFPEQPTRTSARNPMNFFKIASIYPLRWRRRRSRRWSTTIRGSGAGPGQSHAAAVVADIAAGGEG